MIVLGRRRWFLLVPARGLEVRQEAVVKEAAHRSTSLGRPTDNRSRSPEHGGSGGGLIFAPGGQTHCSRIGSAWSHGREPSRAPGKGHGNVSDKPRTNLHRRHTSWLGFRQAARPPSGERRRAARPPPNPARPARCPEPGTHRSWGESAAPARDDAVGQPFRVPPEPSRTPDQGLGTPTADPGRRQYGRSRLPWRRTASRAPAEPSRVPAEQRERASAPPPSPPPPSPPWPCSPRRPGPPPRPSRAARARRRSNARSRTSTAEPNQRRRRRPREGTGAGATGGPGWWAGRSGMPTWALRWSIGASGMPTRGSGVQTGGLDGPTARAGEPSGEPSEATGAPRWSIGAPREASGSSRPRPHDGPLTASSGSGTRSPAALSVGASPDSVP
ncbi:hypothetical protein SHJG_5898 [Streptomyces hygroscopicus subsp. jinggangensis 5008]|nr:hypothetical protein SHJG_5898 [Streptomyces hygroscopicus subsp. jinggangensis 5008]AGF65323.1 hypothetical protein SHJGH_5660 [Streptomyces hygroscopicus subsp. jinggangensis TL01]